MPLDSRMERQRCYRALRARDARFDGRFFTAVLTTGIYCRPICPARPAKLENLVFYPTAAAAHEAGFRPCLRCRPEVSPRFAAWRGTWNSVARALLLIDQGALDTGDVEQLATRLGMGERHLRRLFERHIGAPPVVVAQTRRLQLAKQLLDETTLPITRIADAAGFGSLRRFNDTMRRTYGRAPRELRKTASAAPFGATTDVTLRLPFAPPYDWDTLIAFLAPRAIPGVEHVTPAMYRRTIRHDGTPDGMTGSIEVRPVPGKSSLAATIRFPRVVTLGLLVDRLRHLFDLGADPAAIAKVLSADPRLAPLVRARPGIRVPGAWDGFELAVRAILGQQVTVRGATTLAGKLVAAYGTPLRVPATPDGVSSGESSSRDAALTHLFPPPHAIAALDPAHVATALGMPRARAVAIVELARAAARDGTLLQPGGTLEQSVATLRALPGIGGWTAHYIAMRALREPDAFPASDLGLKRALDDATDNVTDNVTERAEAWRPWRAYAAMYLWTQPPAPR